MTVQNKNSKDVYRGNGVTTVFPFTFDCPEAAYLHVYVGDGTTESEETDNFVLDLVNKRITYPAEGEPLPSSKLLTISRKLPLQQLMDLVEHGPFLAEDLEKAYDELTMMIQQCVEALDRTLKLDLSMELSNLFVPWAAGKSFRINDAGTALETTEDPAKVLPLATQALAETQQARDAILLRPGYIAVEGDLENIDAVAENIENIDTIVTNLDNVQAVGGNITKVTAVADDLTKIDGVYDALDDIDNVWSIRNNIATVAGISADVTTVAGISADVEAVAGNATNISTVADIEHDVTTLAGIKDRILTVASLQIQMIAIEADQTNIDAVADNLTVINDVANDLDNIDAASQNAALSKQYAIGEPAEPPEGSAKYWASQSAQGQIQSDWEQIDNTKKDFIKNKPTTIEQSGITDVYNMTQVDDFAEGKVDKTTTVNGHTLDDDITITKSDVGLSDVANTGDSDTPVPDGTTKLTTGGAYKAFAMKLNISDAATRLGYYSPTLFESNKTYVTIPAGVAVRIDNDVYVSTSATTLQASDVATAANRAGHDYYIYACKPSSGTAPVFVLSANSTVPSGYTATNSRKIGGFHCLCVNAGTLTTTNFVGTSVTHPLSDFVAGDILPTTRWDLHHRPRCSPEGMFYCDKADVWMSIYGMSWDGSKLVSVYGGVWADGTSSKKWHGEAFAECLQLQNMRLPWRHEFQMAAKGSNEQTNIKGAADPTTTGGHQDTASRRMLSNYGGEDMCGVLWQWTNDLGFAGGSGWTESCYNSGVDPRSYGQSYGALYRLRVGAKWNDGACCGSRAADCDASSSYVSASNGCRAAAEPLVRNVEAEYYNYSPVF